MQKENVNINYKLVSEKLMEYEQLDMQLQRITNINLESLVEIAKAYNLYIDINGGKVSLYQIAKTMENTGLSFYDICEKIKATLKSYKI